MQAIHLKPTKESPEVILDRENGIFSITGVSLPEDVKEFYMPLIEWFREYFKSPNEKPNLNRPTQ